MEKKNTPPPSTKTPMAPKRWVPSIIAFKALRSTQRLLVLKNLYLVRRRPEPPKPLAEPGHDRCDRLVMRRRMDGPEIPRWLLFFTFWNGVLGRVRDDEGSGYSERYDVSERKSVGTHRVTLGWKMWVNLKICCKLPPPNGTVLCWGERAISWFDDIWWLMKVSPVSWGIHVWHGKYKQPSTAQVRPYRAASQETSSNIFWWEKLRMMKPTIRTMCLEIRWIQIGLSSNTWTTYDKMSGYTSNLWTWFVINLVGGFNPFGKY